jgi:hypothetical protein
MSSRIAIRLDRGLGWTAPLFVASCRDCGSELARHRNQATAARAAGRTRCSCGTRTARRLPGTTSPTTDLALALYRGDKRTADRIFNHHRCEPVIPLSRPRRRRPA